MSNSADDVIGRRRLVCVPRAPWKADEVEVLTNWEWNVTTGYNAAWLYQPFGTYITFPNIGVNDLSMEAWVRYFPDGLGFLWDAGINTGWNATFMSYPYRNNSLGLGFSNLNASMTFGTGLAPPDNVYQVTGAAPQDGEWHHWCGVCDRSGLMRFYIDGVLLGTVDISADVATDIAPAWQQLVAMTTHAFEPPAGPTHSMGVMGAFAFHYQTLTAAQIKDSVMGRRCQVVAGTVVYCDTRVRVRSAPGSMSVFDAEDLTPFVSSRVPHGWQREVRRLRAVTALSGYEYLVDLSGSGRNVAVETPGQVWTTLDPSWK